MASRKRAAHQPEPRDEEATSPAEERRAEAPAVEEKPAPPSGKAKSPMGFASVFWGLPLLLFIVVAVLKQCVLND